MLIILTNIIECGKHQKYAFKHIFLLDLDYTWTAPGLPWLSRQQIAPAWTLPGLYLECLVVTWTLPGLHQDTWVSVKY